MLILLLTLLVAILADVQPISVKPLFCPDKKTQEQIYEDVINTPAPKSLRNLAEDELETHRIDVLPGVYFYTGYGLSNVILIDAPDGFILVDSMDSATAILPILKDIRENIHPTKKFKAIMYTHHHPDHIGGAIAVTQAQPNDPVEVWAEGSLSEEFFEKWMFNQPLFITRSWRQVGVDLPDGAFISTGIGKRFILDQTTGLLLVPPTHFLNTDQMDVKIAGLDITLFRLPGETSDHMGVYVPSMKVFMIGDDMYKAFPNLYAIRGTPPRPVLEWANSCTKVSRMDIEYLLPSHTLPIVGKANVKEQLEIYSDGIKYVHDQTTRLMNRGLHPDEIAQKIKLPKSIIKNPYLLEHYGVVEWGSKGVFERRMGWFSGLVEELFPLTPRDEAEHLVELLSFSEAVKSATKSIDRGTEKDLRWAIKLTSIFWQARKSINKKSKIAKILALRSTAIRNLAALQTSGNARSYLLRWVLEENCKINNKLPRFTDVGPILLLPVRKLFNKITVMLKAENLDGVVSTNVVHFTDVGITFSMTIRNNVMNVLEEDTQDADLRINVDLPSFREVLLRRKTLEEVGAVVNPSFEAADAFMDYFDDPTVFNF